MLRLAVDRKKQDEFRCGLKEEWRVLWRERFDDKVRAEGVAIRDYPLLLVDRGSVIFASKDARVPCFSEIVGYWMEKGLVYSVDPVVGGWGKFMREHVFSRSERRRSFEPPKQSGGGQQLKKGGRGWLHRA